MSERRQLLYGIMVVLGCFFISTILSLYSLHSIIHDKQYVTNKLLASRIYDSLQAELIKPYIVSQTLQQDNFLIDWLKTEPPVNDYNKSIELRTHLHHIEKNTNCDAVYIISDKSLNLYTHSGILRKLHPDRNEQDQWYSFYRNNTASTSMKVTLDDASRQMACFVNSRLEDENGQFLGICLVCINVNRLQQIIKQYENTYNIKIALTDANGLVQVDTNPANIKSNTIENLPIEQASNGDYVIQSIDDSHNLHTITKHIDNLDWYLVVQQSFGIDDQDVANLFMLNMSAAIIILLIVILCIRLIVWRQNHLVAISYTDALTNLSNRQKLNQDIQELYSSELPDELVIISFDVNNLKEANDGWGHAAGDELISAAASCIHNAFSDYGSCYRIGGDEFLAICQISRQKLTKLFSQFRQQTDSWQGHLISAVSISYGYAIKADHPEATIQELINLADKNMYLHKDKYHHKL